MSPAVTIDAGEIDAVIFDMDGVVTRTASVHGAAWKRLFDEYLAARAQREGATYEPFTDDDYRRYVDGRARFDGVASFLESRGVSLPLGAPDDPPDRETVCGLGNRKNGYFEQHLKEHGAEAFPSTVALIHALHRRGIRTAIISASKNAAAVLRAAGVMGLFEAKVDGRDADEQGFPGKPDPAVFLEAARRLGVPPERAAVVEDAIAGVRAGSDGGFRLVIGVNRGGEAGTLLANGAHVEVRDLAEVTVDGGAELPSALGRLDEIRALADGRQLAVFLDYDGTLTPIVAHPDLAVLSDGMRATLERLAARYPVAIVSGRDLEDVRRHAGIATIWYAGSHGFEIAAPDGRRIEYEPGKAFLPALAEAAAELEEAVRSIRGAWVERKRYAIAVHYRQTPAEDVAAVEAAVEHVGAAHPELRLSGGKKIFELRPSLEWDKGKTVFWLLEALGLGEGVLALYIGDDVTDEDAFWALRETGLGIAVQEAPGPTAARFALRDPDEVRLFLAALCDLPLC